MHYASIGINQVQAYLARSRRLWGRRGASDMLNYLTAREVEVSQDRDFRTAKEVLNVFPDVDFTEDAVDVDSVLNICGNNRRTVQKAAHALALNIKVHLPATHVTTTLREAANYREVIAAELNGSHAEKRVYPPSTLEFPLAHHCDECSSGMAVAKRKDLRLCADCLSRDAPKPRNATLSSRRLEQGFAAEQEILEKVSERTGKLNQVKDLPDLAQLGNLGDEGRRQQTDNHIATIFADGNGLGAFFSGLRHEATKSDEGLEQLRETSRAIKDATNNAMVESICEIRREGEQKMPAVPHIMGGDDILVSVPATRAWPFLFSFLGQMKQELREVKGAERISFSAGMVICKDEYPIGNQVELAEELIRHAKDKGQGKEWNFAWRDVTHDGPASPARCMTLERWYEFSDARQALERLGGPAGGNAARSTVAQELAISDPQQRRRHLAHLAPRLEGAAQLFMLLFPKGWESQHGPDIPEELCTELLDLINLTRWHS